MKKLLMYCVLILSLLGCGDNNGKYIEATKKMSLDNCIEISDRTLETVEDVGVYFIHKLTGDSFKEIASNIEYSITGKIDDNTKIVSLNYNGAKVDIPVEKKGDSYSTSHIDIKGKFGKDKYTFKKFRDEVINEKMNEAEKEYEEDIEEYIEECKKVLK